MLSEHETEFFGRLCAPFEPHQVKILSKSGRNLSYITSRTLMNRLDEVCGPAGWSPEYRMNADGLTCKLSLLVPDQEPGEWKWMAKEDGGGFAGMASEEDNEKSGYSDALKRAGVAWGVARYLYRDGVPDYLGEQRPPDMPPDRPVPPARPAPQRPAPPSRPQPAARPPQGQGQSQYDEFKPPKICRGVFPWLKKQEEHFGAGAVQLSNGIAKDMGFPFRSNEWDEFMTESVCWAVIDEIKKWDRYSGEYEHLEDPRAGE